MHSTEKHRKQKKRQPTKWQKISVNDVTDQGLIYKVYKQLIQLNIKENQNKNGERTWTGIFSKGDIWIVNRHIKDSQQCHLSENYKPKPNEVSSQTFPNVYHQKDQKIMTAGKDVEEREP